MFTRDNTRSLHVGEVHVGGGSPVSVQSMLKTPITRINDCIDQAKRLQACGCEIVRVALPDEESLGRLKSLITSVSIPVIADIHFDYRLAIGAVEAGVAGLRLNPGNIGSEERIKQVVMACKSKGIPIRIGVNSGSLEKDLLKKYGQPCAEAMVESAAKHIAILEKYSFHDLKVSLKASSVPMTIKAYTDFAQKWDYPLHLGITEAGPVGTGDVRSAVGLGVLLHLGLGDTIRVSLTGPPEREVKVGFEILNSLGLRNEGPRLVSCPTCGRCHIDILGLTQRVSTFLERVRTPITVAVMGCVVNGPGEAREADIAIAGGKDYAMVYKRGKKMGRVAVSDLEDTLRALISEMPETTPE